MRSSNKHSATVAVIYARVSSIKQTIDGAGLASQEVRCREFAARKGYEVVAVFQDDVSGSLVERRGMKAMLAFLRKHRARGTIVIIDDLSRLARGLEAHLELRGSIASAGGLLESPSIEFGDDPDSRLVEHLLASVSQHARQKNADQTRDRMKARVSDGFWPFPAPRGYVHVRSGKGRVLVRSEPAASVIAEALEGFASGRFELLADVVRFLQANPLYPKDRSGKVRPDTVTQLVSAPVYAGLVGHEPWDVPLRAGRHEALIGMHTYQRIQERLHGSARAKWRPNLNQDFPLRGFVCCDECGNGLTAYWAKGRTERHPYYHCPRRGCASYGKAVRRADIEGQFEAMLHTVQPTPGLVKVASAMFKKIWEARTSQMAEQGKALAGELVKVERQIGQFLDRIITTDTPSVIRAYEEKVKTLETSKLIIRERMATGPRPASSFDASLRTALEFLANPWKLWDTGSLEQRRAVLKLTFAGQLRYRRNEGFRTAALSLPFKALEAMTGMKSGMVPRAGARKTK